MIFYVGLHQPSDGQHFERACVSVNRLLTRRKPLGCSIILDSGAFTKVARDGGYAEPVSVYAEHIRRLVASGAAQIEIAVAEDWMCEPDVLKRTGKTVEEHQRLTIERYDALLAEVLPVPVMPVLQGYRPSDYVRHIAAYGDRLTPGMWVGVGSVCKRNGAPEQIVDVLDAIKRERPDLRLHGFGVKQTALGHPGVRALLYSADSMAWSFAARKQGRNAHDWREAQAFADKIKDIVARGFQPWQMPLFVA